MSIELSTTVGRHIAALAQTIAPGRARARRPPQQPEQSMKLGFPTEFPTRFPASRNKRGQNARRSGRWCRAPLGIMATRTTVKGPQPQAGACWRRGECLAAGSDEPDEQRIWNRMGHALGTAGWIRTTDLLIHSLYQVFDFPYICFKSEM